MVTNKALKKIKLVVVKESNLGYFIYEFTKRHFATKQMPEGSGNACIVWCIKYALGREEKTKKDDYSALTGVWEDLPPLRMRRIDTYMHMLEDKVEYSVYVDLDTDYALEEILKAKGDYLQINKKTTKYAKYPKFRNLKRNVIINCIKLVMADICTYTMTTDKAVTLEGMMRYYGVEVK